MEKYLYFAIGIIVFNLVQMAGVYAKFGKGLATKLFGLGLSTGGVAVIFGYVLGGEGFSWNLMGFVGFPVAVMFLVVFTLTYRSIMKPLQSATGTLTTSTSQISSTAKQQAATATQQAATVAEVSTTIEEINQTSKSASQDAQQVVQAAEEAVEKGLIGQGAVQKAVTMMENIHDQVQGVTDQILRLNEKNAEIVNIVQSVNELAEQSNLLAVNASIEAAKAGEHGRGFSVVASEVRDLAKQSKAATQQIRALLSEIERESGRAVSTTSEALRRTQDGQADIESVRSVLQQLASFLEMTADKARQIFGSNTQQAAGIDQISSAMESVTQGGDDSAAGARQLEEAVHGLDLIARQLNQTINGTEERQ